MKLAELAIKVEHARRDVHEAMDARRCDVQFLIKRYRRLELELIGALKVFVFEAAQEDVEYSL